MRSPGTGGDRDSGSTSSSACQLPQAVAHGCQPLARQAILVAGKSQVPSLSPGPSLPVSSNMAPVRGRAHTPRRKRPREVNKSPGRSTCWAQCWPQKLVHDPGLEPNHAPGGSPASDWPPQGHGGSDLVQSHVALQWAIPNNSQ